MTQTVNQTTSISGAMRSRTFFCLALLFFGIFVSPSAGAEDANRAAAEVERAIDLTPNYENGKRVYRICAVCHQPEGWGTMDGVYPQIAGQIRTVIIKQMADIRARNRDNPTMLPFALLDNLSVQKIADVSAYIAQLPMAPLVGVGPGTDLKHGKRLYEEFCADCHGDNAEGLTTDHIPLLQGQHYLYLIRQFEWIRDGKRRNADQTMVEQIESFSQRDISAVMDYISRLRPPREKLALPGWRNPDFPRFHRP